jgi:hypothetical protein
VTGAREFEIELPPVVDEDAWISVRGGGLRQPILVKVKRVGLTVGIAALHIDSGLELTSSDLRTLRLGDLAAQIGDLFRRIEQRRGEVFELGKLIHFGADGKPSPPADALEAIHTRSTIETIARWSDRLAGLPATAEAELSRGRGAKPPTTTDLRGFAQVYLEEAGRRGTMTRTARRIGMHRSTAHRWAQLCRQQGFLPDEKETR